MARKIKLTAQEQRLLDSARHSRERTPMPRPVRFADKTKYSRKREKAQWKQEIS